MKKIFEAYLRLYIWILVRLGIARWTSQISRKNMMNRGLVLVDEARKRGMVIENLKKGDRHLKFFRVKLNGKYYYFECIPIGNSYNKVASESVSNKWFSKKLLAQNGFHTPYGKVAKSMKEVISYVREKGYPLVIKPLNQSLCKGVTINIRNEDQLKKAISYVKKYGKKFLVEKFLIGENYRVTIVDGKMAGACLRKFPQVVGDGKSTVKQLINIKNKDPRRGVGKNFTLHPIKIDKNFTYELLAEQKLTLNSIPKKGRVVILNKKINLGSGADTVDVTHRVHPEIVKLSKKVAEVFDAKVLGLDLLMPDISKAPSKKNKPVIIEVNVYPFIDMHHYPYEGKSRNIAAAIWDMIYKELGVEKVKK